MRGKDEADRILAAINQSNIYHSGFRIKSMKERSSERKLTYEKKNKQDITISCAWVPCGEKYHVENSRR